MYIPAVNVSIPQGCVALMSPPILQSSPLLPCNSTRPPLASLSTQFTICYYHSPFRAVCTILFHYLPQNITSPHSIGNLIIIFWTLPHSI